MTTARTFLLCDSPEHAEIADQFVMERLRDVDGSHGAQWSGIHTDGLRYGVLWASPASDLFGVPLADDPLDGDPSVVLVAETLDADGVSDWGQLELVVTEEPLP